MKRGSLKMIVISLLAISLCSILQGNYSVLVVKIFLSSINQLCSV